MFPERPVNIGILTGGGRPGDRRWRISAGLPVRIDRRRARAYFGTLTQCKFFGCYFGESARSKFLHGGHTREANFNHRILPANDTLALACDSGYIPNRQESGRSARSLRIAWSHTAAREGPGEQGGHGPCDLPALFLFRLAARRFFSKALDCPPAGAYIWVSRDSILEPCPMTNSGQRHPSPLRAVIDESSSPVILDARRGSIPLEELLAPAAETRAKAIADKRLWVVNSATEAHDENNRVVEKTFCTIQPFISEDYSAKMREAFLSQRNSREKAMTPFEVIGTRSEVRMAVAPMFASDEVLLRWLPRDI